MCSRRAAPATSSMLEVHKELSNSYREDIDKKLTCMAQPYKTQVLKKYQIMVFWVHKELSNSYREGIDEKLKCTAQPYKTKVLKKNVRILCLWCRDW